MDNKKDIDTHNILNSLISVVIVMADKLYCDSDDDTARNVRKKLFRLWTMSGEAYKEES